MLEPMENVQLLGTEVPHPSAVVPQTRTEVVPLGPSFSSGCCLKAAYESPVYRANVKPSQNPRSRS